MSMNKTAELINFAMTNAILTAPASILESIEASINVAIEKEKCTQQGIELSDTVYESYCALLNSAK